MIFLLFPHGNLHIGILGAWRPGWRLALVTMEDHRAEELLAGYDRDQHTASEEVQNANATIFRNMALANPVAATVRSVALRALSRFKPVVRPMTKKEALVTQKLYVPDGKVPPGNDQDASSHASSRKPSEEDADGLEGPEDQRCSSRDAKEAKW
jgi:hypothetical protein